MFKSNLCKTLIVIDVFACSLHEKKKFKIELAFATVFFCKEFPQLQKVS